MATKLAWSQRTWAVLSWVALATLVAPVATVKWPPLLDYPNHYTRMWLLTGGAEVAPVSEMYKVDWHNAYTNIGIDVVAAVLGRVFSVGFIGPFLIMAALFLPALGSMSLNRRLFGDRHFWQLILVLLAWNSTFVAGFLNFQIGLGLALLGASMEPALATRGRASAWLVRACIAAFALFVHAFGWAFYAALIAGVALGPTFSPLKTRHGAVRAARQVALALWPTLVPLALMLLLAHRLPGAHATGAFAASNPPVEWQPLREFGLVLVTPFSTYDLPVDAPFAAFFLLPVIVARFARRLRAHAGLVVVGLLLLAAAACMPKNLAGTAWIDKRLPLMAVLALGASIRPDLPPSSARPWRWAVAIVPLLAVIARSVWVTGVWRDSQRDVASVERALSHVSSGAAVLPMEHASQASEMGDWKPGRYILHYHPCYWHLADLAIVERHAFVPTLFTAAGKQPIVVLPPWDSIAVPEGRPPDVTQLDDPRAPIRFPYLASWPDRFDFILVLNADRPNHDGPLPPDGRIELVADEGFAQLYRVLRSARSPVD